MGDGIGERKGRYSSAPSIVPVYMRQATILALYI